MVSCNICGHSEFIPTAGGRLSKHGLPPVCASCKSLERHRIGREFLGALQASGRFAGLRLLLISRDRTVDPCWFGTVNRHVGADATGELRFPEADGAYDFIMCSNILESVVDHRATLKELLRVLSPEGLMYLVYSHPVNSQKTREWGAPDPNRFGHRRTIGRDFEDEFADIIPDAHVVAREGTDPVTGDGDLAYLVTRSRKWTSLALASRLNCRLVS